MVSIRVFFFSFSRCLLLSCRTTVQTSKYSRQPRPNLQTFFDRCPRRLCHRLLPTRNTSYAATSRNTSWNWHKGWTHGKVWTPETPQVFTPLPSCQRPSNIDERQVHDPWRTPRDLKEQAQTSRSAPRYSNERSTASGSLRLQRLPTSNTSHRDGSLGFVFRMERVPRHHHQAPLCRLTRGCLLDSRHQWYQHS